MKLKLKILMLSLILFIACMYCNSQQPGTQKPKIGLQSDGANNYLIFKNVDDTFTITAVKGTGFLNFSPDSTLFYYLEKRGYNGKHDLFALDGNNTSRKITELNANSKISVNNNGNVVVEPGQGSPTSYLLAYNKEGELIYYDSTKSAVWKSDWTPDSKYYVYFVSNKNESEEHGTLKLKVLDAFMNEVFNYTFNDRSYRGSNFFKYQQDILSVYYYDSNLIKDESAKKYVAKINLITKQIERSETTW